MSTYNLSSEGQTLGEKISNELRVKIISGENAPGTVLSENQIAKEYKTSRSPVRDAFKVLANEGLIKLERMGAVVTGLDEHDLKELYEVRHLIEYFTLKKLIRQDVDDVIKALLQIIDKMKLAAKYENVVEFAMLDFSFHNLLIGSIEHKRILYLWNNIKHIVQTVLLITMEKRFSERREEIDILIEKHFLIIEVLQTKKLEKLEVILEDHFTDSHKSIEELL
ncbi:GntR family transcriptional regulator [Bacillus taeanensis]|uniref:GntR family transcriptional regulator n=1 Tax=Bacillus taeanensis TaxID=273032 RepID=A0A366XY10_9BACI|nr:GntR family transcriptional regulator [Bacillus taeanensis]RBW70035.1 GntR family transcriptional regulator [Bacillus taeanensis]